MAKPTESYKVLELNSIVKTGLITEATIQYKLISTYYKKEIATEEVINIKFNNTNSDSFINFENVLESDVIEWFKNIEGVTALTNMEKYVLSVHTEAVNEIKNRKETGDFPASWN